MSICTPLGTGITVNGCFRSSLAPHLALEGLLCGKIQLKKQSDDKREQAIALETNINQTLTLAQPFLIIVTTRRI